MTDNIRTNFCATCKEQADCIEAQAAEIERLREALTRIALGFDIELDEQDGCVEVWLDAEELSDIARAALEGKQ